MDDVDQIVLSSLKEIGYNFKNDLENLKLCPFEDMVEMTIYCLNTIKPELKFPQYLPPVMSAKFNMCTELANVCKELGYKGEVGCHTFLYSNVADIRNVLIFLVQHLPRQMSFEETEKVESKSSVTIKQKTIEELQKALTSRSKEHFGMCLTPFLSASLETGTLLPNQKIDCKPLEWRDFVAEKLPFVDEQLTDYQYFLPSLISLNAYGKLNPKKSKSSSFTLRPLEESFFAVSNVSSYDQLDSSSVELPDSYGENSVTSDTLNESLFESKVNLAESDREAECITLEKEIESLEETISTLTDKLDNIVCSNNELKKTLEEKNTRESTLQQSLVLLPDSENNIPKLLAANEKCRNKMKNLEIQWQAHKETLLKKQSDLKKILNMKTDEKNELIQIIMDLRQELFSVIEQIEQKDAIEQKLDKSNELKGVRRSEYIQRIFEIIKNIKKQNVQIDKILKDMRYVQKEINTLSGKIDRSFSSTEQLIANSRNDEFSQEIHKLVLALHRDISDILTMTGESGNYSRESKDLEEQLQTLEDNENIAESIKNVLADLKTIKEEQAVVLNEIAVLEYGKNQPELKKTENNNNNEENMNEKEYKKPQENSILSELKIRNGSRVTANKKVANQEATAS